MNKLTKDKIIEMSVDEIDNAWVEFQSTIRPVNNIDCINCSDSYNLINCTNLRYCDKCEGCFNCGDSKGLINCHKCYDSINLKECIDCNCCVDLIYCNFCTYCIGIEHQQYMIFNIQFETNEWLDIMHRINPHFK
jgi:hypothetical protein